MPLFFATPASADDIQDARVALDAGNALIVDLTVQDDQATAVVTSAAQEVISAQSSLDTADQLVQSLSQDVTDAQIAYDTQITTQITYTDTGITATVYNDLGYNNAPPLGAGTVVSTQTVAEINFQWGGGSVLSGPTEDVQIKFEGTITAPETKEYSFYGPADDGFILKINGETIINDWHDKGGGGSVSSPVLLTAGVANTFEAWYYENGGGAWVQLNWYDNGWKVIPAVAFNTPHVVETKDPSLLIVLNNAQSSLVEATADQAAALSNLNSAISIYNSAVEAKGIVYASLQDAIAAIPTLQQNLADVVEAKRASDEAARLAAEQAAAEEKSRLEAEEIARRAAEEAAKQPVIIVPTPTEEPVVPTPEPTVDPEPTTPPAEEPTPAPTQSEEPVEEPTTPIIQPLPEPEPPTTPEVQPEPELRVDEAVSEIENLVKTAPKDLTDAQVEQLIEAALVVFETAEQGSPAYEQALEALAVAAEADDAELPAGLAAIPLLGDVAGAALEVFNNLGNVGADMAPAVREEAEKTVIASVIATGAAVNAVAAAATAASTTSTGSSGGGASGGSSGGSGSTRRKE